MFCYYYYFFFLSCKFAADERYFINKLIIITSNVPHRPNRGLTFPIENISILMEAIYNYSTSYTSLHPCRWAHMPGGIYNYERGNPTTSLNHLTSRFRFVMERVPFRVG